MTTTKFPIFLWAAIACTAALSLGSIFLRHRAEAANHAVGLALEMGVVRDLALASGKPLPDVLQDLKAHGLTGVALTEDTVEDLTRSGSAVLTQGQNGTYVAASSDTLYRIQKFLTAKSGRVRSRGSTPELLFAEGVDGQEIRQLPVGISPTDAKTIHAAGLEIIARHQNFAGTNQAVIDATLEFSSRLGARFYLPAGDSVLGSRELLEETADALCRNEMSYVTPEFVKLTGDTPFTLKHPDLTIRLHSAQQAEVDKMTLGGVEERYSKAYRERNIRWLLLRPFTLASSNVLLSADVMLNSVSRSVVSVGGILKAPRPFQAPPDIRPLFALAGLATGASAFGLFWILPIPQPWKLGLGAVSLLLGAAAWLPGARTYVGLMGAITFPLLAYAHLFEKKEIVIWRDYALVSLISLVGGLCTAGQLVGLQWMVQAVQFSGIKLAHFGPIALIGLWLVLRQTSLKELGQKPILWASLALTVGISGAVLFMLSRTGNDNPTGVSSTELAFRSILDTVLYTRPRTKEFLIGHPALWVGIGLFGLAQRRASLMPAASVLLVISAIGQTSVVNTLCHAHTPVLLSLARILIGHAIGCILGFALWLILGRTVVQG